MSILLLGTFLWSFLGPSSLAAQTPQQHLSPTMKEVIIPFLERYQRGMSSMMSDPYGIAEWEREMGVIADHVSQLAPAYFNSEVLFPLQQFYVEKRELRMGIFKLMEMIESGVEEELDEYAAQSWYGDIIDSVTSFGGAYVLVHTLGSATSKTKLGRQLFAGIKKGIKKFSFKVKASSHSKELILIKKNALGPHGGGKSGQNWIKNKFNESSSFAFGLALTSGAGLVWGGGEGIYHELYTRKLSPSQVLLAAHQYLVLENSFKACVFLGQAKELREQWDEGRIILDEDGLEDLKKTLEEWKVILDEIDQDLGELNILAPEFKTGVQVNLTEFQEATKKQFSQDFWEYSDGSCELKEENITLSIHPLSMQIHEAKKILNPLFDRYLPSIWRE